MSGTCTEIDNVQVQKQMLVMVVQKKMLKVQAQRQMLVKIAQEQTLIPVISVGSRQGTGESDDD